jgi:hypothetical protein
MVMAGDAVKQHACHNDFLSEKSSVSAVLFVIEDELYFSLIAFLHIDVVRCKNTNRFIEFEDPDRFRFIAIGDT